MENKIISDLSLYKSNYVVTKNIFIQIFWYIISFIFFQSYFFPFYRLKILLLQFFGANIKSNLVIKPGVKIKYPWNLTIGNNVWIGEDVWIDNLCDVIIGDNVCISQSSYLFTGNHNYKSRSFDLFLKPIVIKDGSWVCAKAIICPGVVINSNAIITVGSVLTKDAETNKVYTGNPAILVKDRI
jgi:putative colanic acid biosynthesis acetyltransferase WcaF